MGSVALNRSLQIYLKLQSRNLAVSWLRRGYNSSARTIRCIQSDSFPSQIKNSPVPVSLASLRKQKSKEESCDDTALEQPESVCNNVSEKRPTKTARLLKRNKKQEHRDIDVDLKRSISVCRNSSEDRLVKTFNLDESCSSEEKEINENEISKSTFEDAKKVAIELLSGRAFSVAELRKKLRSKKFPLQVVDKVIADIENRGLVNDGLYAETFSRSRWLSAAWGPRRIKQALLQKGVSEADVTKATRKVFEDDDGYSDGTNHNHDQTNSDPYEIESSNTQLTMSDSSMNRLFIQASKQWLRGQDLLIDKRKARVVRWLQYRGFNWGVVTVILQRLQSQFTNAQDNGNINDIKNNKGGGGTANKEIRETISEESMDKLLVEVSKQWTKGQGVSIENRKARIARWLRYRGYSWEVVGIILKRLLPQ